MIPIFLKRFVVILFIMGIPFAQNNTFSNPEQKKPLVGAYLKSSFGYSHGLKPFDTGINEIINNPQKVYLRPGSGVNISGTVGIFILRNICLELGAGYFTNIKQFTNGKIQFDKFPIFGNLLYHIALSENKFFYFGAGAGEYLLPNFITEINKHLRIISYTHVQFVNGTIGLRSTFEKTRSFWFAEVKYNSCKQPTTTVETFNLRTTKIEENFLLPSLDGINFNFGIGFGL